MANTQFIAATHPAWDYSHGRFRWIGSPGVAHMLAEPQTSASTNAASCRRFSVRTNSPTAALNYYRGGQGFTVKVNGAVLYFPISPYNNAANNPTLAHAAAGTALAAGTYRAVYTWLTAQGWETQASNEVTVTIAAGDNIQTTIPAAPTGATQANVYLSAAGGATGTEKLQATVAVSTTATTTATQTAAVATGTAAYPAANSNLQASLFTGKSGWQTIEVAFGQLTDNAGLWIDPAYAVAPPVARPSTRPKLAVFGHSYVEGAQCTYPGHYGLAALVGDQVGYQGVMWGQGGTDVDTPSGGNYQAQDRVYPDVVASRPDAVLIVFGRNYGGGEPQYQADYQALVLQPLRAALGRGVPIFCLGQFQASGSDGTWTARNAGIQAAAAAVAGCTYVDPSAWIASANWFAGAGPVYISSDNIHPNDAGYAYLAGKVAAAIAPYMP